MRTNINEILESQPSQHSNEWFKNRLGHFTGSQIGRLMKRGRGKGDEWSADAETYIKEVVAERLINPVVVEIPDLLEQYLDFTCATSKMMAWGNDQEYNALKAYTAITGRAITRCGSFQHEELATFWDSPDGLLLGCDGVIEIKCPTPKTHTEYLLNIHDAEGLKDYKPEYYWQCLSHMAVTGAKFCDWVSYCPFLKPSIHIVRIERDSDAIAQLLERIDQAEQMAQALIKKAKSNKVVQVS